MNHGMAMALCCLAASACGGNGLFARPVEAGGGSYDARTCVENALRRSPDPSILADALARFSEACTAREAAACSALGVMFELGRGTPVDRERARSLYTEACTAREPHGCANLGELLITEGRAERARGLVLLRRACNDDVGRACAALGRAYRDGRGVEPNPGIARSLLDVACGDGETVACLELADMPGGGALDESPARLRAALAVAAENGLSSHELGDACLIAPA